MQTFKGIEVGISIHAILEKIVLVDITSESYDDDIARIGEELRSYYDNKGRHLYSEVSTFLYKINDTKYSKKVLKLEDHIRLEILRAQHLIDVQSNNAMKLKQEIESISRRGKETQKKFNQINSQYNKQKDNIEGLNNQIISIIGIFSAIVITFFGGINFLESVLASINNISKYRLVFVVFMVGFVMFNTIFMLLNFIYKLTEKDIRSNCKYKVGDQCENNCINKDKLKCIKEKHPTVYWVNFSFFMGMIVITFMYYIDYYNIISKFL